MKLVASYKSKIIKNEIIGNSVFKLCCEKPPNINTGKPGQFAMIKGDWGIHPLLPRPISIFNSTDNTIEFIVKIAGTGTKLLSKCTSNDHLQITSPLGNSFPVDNHNPMLIAGGIGLPPIYNYKMKYGGEVLYGCSEKKDVLNLNPLWELSTIDGSSGFMGTVVDLIKIKLQTEKPSSIIACGPMGMLKAIGEISLISQIPFYGSLETFMGCGFGVCNACAIENGKDNYIHICKDGPVFKYSKGGKWELI
jgi:dihydroorotate dehydrogenase electron transfer subunit